MSSTGLQRRWRIAVSGGSEMVGEAVVDEREAWLRLALTPGLGVVTLWRLVRALGSPQAVITADSRRLAAIAGVQRRHLDGLVQRPVPSQAVADECERLAQFGARAVVFCDREYPQLLREISDPPPLLRVVGDLSLLRLPAVAVVGSRAASSYGRHAAFDLGKGLAAAGVLVVSGLAMGVDAEAHRGALEASGATAAVLGCGLDVIYPRSNAALYRQIGERGLLISEYPLGTTPDSWRFPARNRIIAGSSRGVVVVEAARNSGSLITAQMGIDFGREVFAVPGQFDSDRSEGCHLLLRDGASLVMGVETILSEVGINSDDSATVVSQASPLAQISPQAARLLVFIDSYGVAKDVLVERSGLSVGEVNELLLLLELDGIIESLPGDQVRRVR